MNGFSKAFLLLIASTALSGCQTPQLFPGKAPAAKVIAQEVRDLYLQAGVTLPEKSATANEPKSIDPPIYAQTGYHIVDINCSNYFDAITKASNGLKMTKADITAVGTSAAVIGTLAKASAKQVGIAASAFGLAAVGVDNVEQYAFATPYPSQTRVLILKALAEYRRESPPSAVLTLPDAQDRIAGYAGICTFSGIAALAEESLAKSKPTAVKNGSQQPPTITIAD